jgi:DNA glycosylase AlkZ-like
VSRRRVTDAERRARIAVRHHLTPATRASDVAAIARDLVALHSTDPVAVYLSATARMETPSLAAVDDALYEARTVVRHHAMRRTLWVFTPDVARWAHASTTTATYAVERRRLLQALATNGISEPERWLENARRAVLEVLDGAPPMPARRIGELLPDLGVPLLLGAGTSSETTAAAYSRVLLVSGFEGEVVRARPMGRWINGQYRWTLMRSWLPGGVAGHEPDEAASSLVDLYLSRFGPVTIEDMRWWTGWTVTAVRRALAASRATEVELEDGSSAWLAHDDVPRSGGRDDVEPWAALLPALDPTTMGWKHRAWYLDDRDAQRLFDRNGNAGPTVWADGRIIGGWAQRADGTIAVRVLADAGGDQLAAIDAAAHEVEALLTGVRISVRFPSPLTVELRA